MQIGEERAAAGHRGVARRAIEVAMFFVPAVIASAPL